MPGHRPATRVVHAGLPPAGQGEPFLPGPTFVAPSDAYPGVRTIAAEHLEPRGVEVRLVPTDETALREALPGARLVWRWSEIS